MLLPTLAFLTTITAVISSLGAPLVPSIAVAYDVRLTTAQWSLTATLLVGAVATPVVGRFASGRLRRPTILVGLGVVTTGCVLAIVPSSYAVLIAGRAMQGVGMALLPLAIAVARDALVGEPMNRAIALLSVTTVAGAGLGYPLTALVAELGGLPAAYGLGAALTGATLAMAWRHIPGTDAVEPMRVDWIGAGLLSAGMVAVLLAVSEGEAWAWTSPLTLGLGLLGLLLLVVWGGWTLRSRTPLVDLRMAVLPGIAAPNLVALVAGLGMYSLLTLAVVLVRADEQGFGLGLPVLVAGLILVPYAVMSVLGNQLARRRAHASRPRVAAADRLPDVRRLDPAARCGPRAPLAADAGDGARRCRQRLHVLVAGGADGALPAAGRDQQRDRLQPGAALPRVHPRQCAERGADGGVRRR